MAEIFDTSHIYGDGVTTATYGQNSKIFYWDKAGIRAATRKKCYQQFADSRTLPQNTGQEYRVSIYHNIYDRLPFSDATWNDMSVAKEFSESFKKYGYLSGRDIAEVTEGLYGTDGMTSNGDNNGYRLLEGEKEANKVSIKKSTITTKIQKFGLMIDYTEESLLFSEDRLEVEYRRQLGEAASLLYEDLMQVDVLSTPNRFYAGAATSIETMGEGIGTGTPDSVTLRNATEETYKVNFELFQKAAITLTKYRCPRRTHILTGSDKFKTTPVAAGHYAIVPLSLRYDLQNIIRGATYEKEFAFKEVESYASQTTVADCEIGALGDFRFIASEQTMVYRGQGAEVESGYVGSLQYTAVDDGTGTGTTVNRFDVYPIVVIGPDSFSTISLMGHNRITFMHKPPSAIDKMDVYGVKGYFSCKFWYAGLITRPERILQIMVLSSY